MIDWEEFYRRFREPGFIAGFEIQNRLGGGAFGEVYKARRTSIGKAYAIKFLKIDEAAQRDAVERELEQVRLFAAIDHPNLVTIEDMGVVLDIPYLVMGYAGEDTLAKRMFEGDLGPGDALSFVVQTCRGVLALHDRRLAHFDLKPSNVFLRGNVARVGDYGLAKLMVDGQRTLSFGRGTPQYMAPEMLRNRADHRADIYSLGVILFECLSGEAPYALGDGAFGLVLREDDVPPEYPESVPAAIRPVITRCLRLQPEDRYASVHELLVDLGQNARQGDSVTLPWDGAADTERAEARVAGAPAPDVDAPGAGVPSEGFAGGSLKVAAAELARGAVEVARGALGGVLGASGSAAEREPGGAVGASAGAGAAPRSGAQGPGAIGDDVVSVHTLDEPEERTPGPGGDPGPVGRGGVLAILDRVRSESPEERRRPIESRIRPLRPPVDESQPVTIPVPPAASGGPVGTIGSVLVLGVEVMVTLVTGPTLAFARGLGRTRDGVVQRVPFLFSGAVRWVLFVLFMALLGGLAALALMLSAS